MKQNGYFIASVKFSKDSRVLSGISLDLWFKTEDEANECLASDLYTDRQRKNRRVLPAYENGNYVGVDGQLIRIAI